MSELFFPENDTEYSEWMHKHKTNGFVLAWDKKTYNRLHQAWCSSISAKSSRGKRLTSVSRKACSTNINELWAWALANTEVIQSEVTPCKHCWDSTKTEFDVITEQFKQKVEKALNDNPDARRKRLNNAKKEPSRMEVVSIVFVRNPDASDHFTQYVKGCNAVASCLGHNMSFKGMYGHPRRLVTDAVRRLCGAIKENKPETPVKFVLMNTTGNSNRDLSEQITFGQKCVIWLLRLLLPPHVDNEKAADYLRTKIGQNNSEIEWAAVRPDNLINEDEVTEYEEYPSPIRSAIFDVGATSRINVGHFMTKLITDHDTWIKWKGQMPVIYNMVKM